MLFSSAIKRKTNTFFITTNGLNDAKNILVNGKLYQGIGAIYTSEIENWDELKTESHWVAAILQIRHYQLLRNIFLSPLKLT